MPSPGLLLSSYFILPYLGMRCDGCVELFSTSMSFVLTMFDTCLKILCIVCCRRALLLPWALHDLEELEDDRRS